MAGINKRSLTIDIAGSSVTAKVAKASVSGADRDNDFVTFEDAAAGGARDYNLNLTFEQDAASGSLWTRIWDAAGSEVAVRIRPYGNTTATASQPHFTGTVVVKEPDGDILGGEADASVTAKQTVEVVWPFTEKPVKVTTGT